MPVCPVGSLRLPMRYSTHQLIKGALCCSLSSSVMPLANTCRVTGFACLFACVITIPVAMLHRAFEAASDAAILEAHLLHQLPIIEVAPIDQDRLLHLAAYLAHIE